MEDEWKQKLTQEQYKVMREKGTEAPFSGKYWDSHEICLDLEKHEQTH